jgi:hypothetical protein
MTLTGICYVCSKPAMYSCSLCGKIACIDHYDKDKRACSNCLAKYGDKLNNRGKDPNEILF